MKTPKRHTYQDYVDQLKRITRTKLPTLAFVYGSSQYLIHSTEDWFKDQSDTAETLESTSFSSSNLEQILNQQSIFDSEVHKVIRVKEKNHSFLKKIKAFNRPEHTNIRVLFSLDSQSIPASLQKEAIRLKAEIIVCTPPTERELPKFIRNLGQKHGVNLDDNTCHCVASHLGNDLVKINNELKSLSLIFPENISTLTIKDLSKHLNYMKEDTAFKIEQYILTRDSEGCTYLIHELLKRGESPLALLGILSHFCRKTLQSRSLLKKGLRSDQIAKTIGVPPFVIQKMIPYLSKVDLNSVKKAHSLCQEADTLFKSKKSPEELLLNEIIFTLMNF